MGEGELASLNRTSWNSAHETFGAWSTLVGLAKSLRPWQWYKQLVLYIALVFSLSATNPQAWLDITLGAFLFSGVAGAVYLVNDVCDVDEDRSHPTKRHRPIASGQVPIPTAIASASALGGISLAGAWSLSPAFFAIVLLYVAQNAAYNTVLRDVMFADLMVIGTGFVLRAVAGVVLVASVMSPWLVLCTFQAALLLGLGKRKAEAQRRADRGRESLEGYHPELVNLLLAGVTSTLLVAYSLYTFSGAPDPMMATIPFAFYAVFRYAYLVWEDGMERPETLFLDRGMLANLAIWGAIVLAVLYAPALPSLA